MEPWFSGEQRFDEELQGADGWCEGPDDREDGILAVHGVGHAFVWETAC